MGEQLIENCIQQFVNTIECGECNRKLILKHETVQNYFFHCLGCGLKIKVNKNRLKVEMFELIQIASK